MMQRIAGFAADGSTVAATVEPYAEGFRVTVYVGNGNGWGVGVTFPTENAAIIVAQAIVDNA